DDRAGENMRADLASLLHHDDVEVRIELLQPDRGRQARGPGADDDDVEFHGFARGEFLGRHDLISARIETFSLIVGSLFPIFTARTTMEMRLEGVHWPPNWPKRDVEPRHDARARHFDPRIAGLLSGGRRRLRLDGGTGEPARRAGVHPSPPRSRSGATRSPRPAAASPPAHRAAGPGRRGRLRARSRAHRADIGGLARVDGTLRRLRVESDRN